MLPVDVRSLDPELASAFDAVDWEASPIGSPSTWSMNLRHAVDACLHTGYACTLLWGPELVMIYNAAYAPLIGAKHPQALGRPVRESFPEAWHQVEPLLTRVCTEDAAISIENLLVPLERRGFLEDCFFSFSYSPVHDDDGQVAGVLDIVAETTAEQLAVRRLRRFAELRGALAEVDSADDLPDVLARTFADDEDLIGVRLDLSGSGGATNGRPPPEALAPGRVLVQQGPEGAVAWLRLASSSVSGTAVGRDAEPARPSAPVLSARLNPRLCVDDPYEEHVALIGSAVSQAWDRLAVLHLERQVAAAEREVSLTLQRMLLGRPAPVPGIEIAVRYDPAAVYSNVGGDWYDAFLADDGEVVLSMGDVAGHDLVSISVMSQVRTLLRGLAFRSADDPGTVIALLDDVLAGLGLDTLASGLLARLSPPDADGARTLSWSNAGHPPPLVLAPDGTTRLLEATPEPLLGLVGLPGSGERRATHHTLLAPGSTVVLYTDGLVERPQRHLDEGFRWLRATTSGGGSLTAEELADLLVDDLPGTLEDDVALMVVKLEAYAPADAHGGGPGSLTGGRSGRFVP